MLQPGRSRIRFPMRSLKLKELNSVAFRPQANYTYRATAACRRSAKLWRIEGVAWSAQRIPTAVNLSFQDWTRYFYIQVAPQLSSRGWVDPVPDPLLLRKCGRAGMQSRDLWICCQELWPLDHRGGPDEIIGFFKWPNPSSLITASTQPLTEMSTMNLPGGGGGKGWPERKADNLTAICEPIV
jgi:hypothetical protein